MELKEGQRVILPGDEALPEERGVVLGVDEEIVTVQIDRKYFIDRFDDGIREVFGPGYVIPEAT